MMKHSITSILVLILLLGHTFQLTAQKPNILMIMSDDQANRTISAYGAGINDTPGMDRVANEGAIFMNSYCANSICQPSRAAILTGKHSHKNGVFGNGSTYDNTQQQLPGILQSNGYKTAVIGKWHLKGEDPGDSFDFWNILTEGGGQGYYYNPTFISHTGVRQQVEGYSADLIADQSLNWLDDNSANPFCLMVHFKGPHVTRMPMIRNLNMFDGEEIPEPETLYDDYATREKYASSAINRLRFDIETTAYNYFPKYGEYTLADYQLLERMTEEQRIAYHAYYDAANQEYDDLVAAGTVVPGEKSGKAYAYQRFIKDYLKVVAGIDQNVERLLQYLDEHNLAENTIVIYCSDQSYFTGQHGYYEKRFIYDDGMKMPLLMRYPNHILPNTKVDQMVQNIDFAPTLLDYVGIAVPDDMQGESFKQVVEGDTPQDWKQSVYYHYYDHGKHGIPRHEGIRTHQYKLINFYTDDAWELYDLVADPDEMNNVYKDPAYGEIVQNLKLELAILKRKYEVPGSEERAEDFEGGNYFNGNAKLKWNVSSTNGVTFNVLSNPQINEINDSAKSGKVVKSTTNESANLMVNLDTEFWDLSTSRKATIQLKTSVETTVALKFSKDGLNEKLFQLSTVSDNQWHDYEFDLSSIPYNQLQNTFNQLELIFGYNDAVPTGIFWFDNLLFQDNLANDLKNIGYNELLLFPNPTHGLISFASENAINKVEVFDMKGTLQLSVCGSDIEHISLQHLSKGNYLVRISTKDNYSIGKVYKS